MNKLKKAIGIQKKEQFLVSISLEAFEMRWQEQKNPIWFTLVIKRGDQDRFENK